MRDEIIKVVEDVLREYGYEDIEILEEYHRSVQKVIYKVSVDNKIIVIRGIANTVSEAVIEGNTLAHIFLGNDKGFAPGIIENQDGKRYVQKAGYWFYVLEYVEGENLKENMDDEYDLGKLLKRIHTHADYNYPSNLNENKREFYDWFHEKSFKSEFDKILDCLPDFQKYDRCFIHSDVGPHNSLRKINGDIVLIDLDDSGIGSRYLDLGWPFIMQFVEYEKKTGSMKYRFDLAEAFLKGYYGDDRISAEEYDLLWQGAIYMHISYMKEYGEAAVNSLWSILKYGIKQKEILWQIIQKEDKKKI